MYVPRGGAFEHPCIVQNLIYLYDRYVAASPILCIKRSLTLDDETAHHCSSKRRGKSSNKLDTNLYTQGMCTSTHVHVHTCVYITLSAVCLCSVMCVLSHPYLVSFAIPIPHILIQLPIFHILIRGILLSTLEQ